MAVVTKIEFYSVGDDYGFMSNFAPYPVKIFGKQWKTSEHFFQAMKFRGTPHEKDVQHTSGPAQAAEYGRDRKRPLRKDWEHVKDDVMRLAVLHKFLQNTDIRTELLATGDAKLVEHTENDRYWGDGGNGSGRNMLGFILMEVRNVLRDAEDETSPAVEKYVARLKRI